MTETPPPSPAHPHQGGGRQHSVGSARRLRKDMTETEKLLWSKLRRRQMCGAYFRRQSSFRQYVLDVVCHEARLVIELDGGQHAERVKQDQRRTRLLESEGYQVLRFWNNALTENLDGVLQTIHNALESRLPKPDENNPPP